MAEVKQPEALAKRINYLIRELEVEALDLVMCSKSIDNKKFGEKELASITNRLVKYEDEMRRISAAWQKYVEVLYGTDSQRT